MPTTKILGKEINALSASYASTAQTLLGSAVSASYALTASFATTASFALAVAGGGGGGDTTAVEAQFYFLM